MSDHSGGASSSRRRQRRVAEEHRKRSAQSCDLCRKKRCKCIPSPSGGEACVTCQAQDIACTYKLPRKTRFYGSVDDLSDRYRCLDAIVKAVFPNDATETALDLWRLGQRMGYSMPEISRDRAPPPPVNLDDVLGQRAPEPPTFPVAALETQVVPSSGPQSIGTGGRYALTRSSSVEDTVRLVRDTTGGEHYIGPSGSLQFLAQLRRLLISHGANGAAAKFTQDDTAQALEADSTQVGTDDPEPEHDQRTDLVIPPAGHSPSSVNSSIAQDFTAPSAEDIRGQRRELPPPEAMEPLLQSYWRHVHPDYPLFHRGTFEDEYEAFLSQSKQWRQNPSATDAHSCDWGWMSCLRMMLVFGSLSEPRIPHVDHGALRRQCVTATRRLLPQMVSRCTLSNVRALVLLSLFLHSNNERNASWVLLGAAVRSSVALGLHRSSALSSFRPIEREVRKRVFCTLYGFEQFLASSLGRPGGLNDVDIEVNPPKGGFLDGGSADGNQLTELSSSLHQILAKARIVSERHNSDGTSIEDVLQSLEGWSRRVSANRSRYIPPIKLGIRLFATFEGGAMDLAQLRTLLDWQDPSHLRETLLLHAEYRYVGLLVTRSALLKDVAASSSQSGLPPPTGSMSLASTTCLWHASQLAQVILLLDSFSLLNGVSSLDVFYAYSAAMALNLRLLRRPTVLHRSSELEGPEEDEIQKCLRDLTSSLRRVVLKVEKSGTMRRFARVMTTFEECISSQPSRNALPSVVRNEGHGPQAQSATDQYFPSMAPNAGTMAPSRFHHGPGVPMSSIGGLVGLSGWPNGLGETIGELPDTLWMDPNMAVDGDRSPVEWRDVESLLARVVPSWN